MKQHFCLLPLLSILLMLVSYESVFRGGRRGILDDEIWQ